MESNLSFIILLGILTGIGCRTIISSSRNEEAIGGSEVSPGVTNFIDDHTRNFTIGDGDYVGTEEFQRFFHTQSLNLEKILADFAARTADFEDHEERAAQWLRLLKQMLQSLTSDEPSEKSRSKSYARFNDVDETSKNFIDGDKKKNLAAEYNWLENLFEFLDQQDIDGQSSDHNQSHVQSRYENSSSHLSIPDVNKINGISEMNEKNVDTSGVRDLEELNVMLVGVGNEIERIRRYFHKFCSEHHSMPWMTWHVEDRNGDETSRNIPTKETIEKIRGLFQEQ